MTPARTSMDVAELARIRRLPIQSHGFMALFVLTLGLAVWGVIAVWDPGEHPLRALTGYLPALGLGTLLLMAGELIPIQVPRSDDTTTQTHFSLSVASALVCSGPVWLVLLGMVLPAMIDDIRRRRPLFKLAFNVAQYIVAICAARLSCVVLAGIPFAGGPVPPELASVPGVLLAGLVLVVVNELQVSAAACLLLRESPWRAMFHDLRMTVVINLVMVGVAPVVGYLLFHEPVLSLLLLLPAMAIGQSSRIAAHRHMVSLTDPLTGLPNRSMIGQEIERALTDHRSGGGPVALLMLDVDYFKDVNDALGHHTGDLLLIELGRRARRFTDGPGEVAARLGGDEFALLLRAAPDEITSLEVRARSVAGQLLATLNEPLDLGGVRISVQCSVGVVVVTEPEIDTTELIKRADYSMYQAKRERARYSVYDGSSKRGGSAAKLSLLADLRDAVKVHQLEVHYQPLIDGATGDMGGVEALCRWNRDGHGWLSPSVFIPLAESAGMIDQLTGQVLDRALADVRWWQDNGLDLQVSVNLSARLVSDSAIPSVVAAALQRHGIEAGRLTIEVTESSVVTDPSRAVVVLAQLRQIGVRLSMDDFGTGFSSLALLQHLEVDELKVDRSFVADLDTVASDAILVRSTVDLAHSLGLEVVAEGVERVGVADRLRDMGCDRLQGYLYGGAVSAEEILRIGRGESPPTLGPLPASEAGDLSLDLTDDAPTLGTKRTMRLPGPRSSTMSE